MFTRPKLDANTLFYNELGRKGKGIIISENDSVQVTTNLHDRQWIFYAIQPNGKMEVVAPDGTAYEGRLLGLIGSRWGTAKLRPGIAFVEGEMSFLLIFHKGLTTDVVIHSVHTLLNERQLY